MSPSAGSVNIADAPPLSATITRSSGVARCNISHASRAASSDDSSGTGCAEATTLTSFFSIKAGSVVATDPRGITAIPATNLSPIRRSISCAIPSDAFPTASKRTRDAPAIKPGNMLRTRAAAVHRKPDEPRRIDRRNRSAINPFKGQPSIRFPFPLSGRG